MRIRHNRKWDKNAGINSLDSKNENISHSEKQRAAKDYYLIGTAEYCYEKFFTSIANNTVLSSIVMDGCSIDEILIRQIGESFPLYKNLEYLSFANLRANNLVKREIFNIIRSAPSSLKRVNFFNNQLTTECSDHLLDCMKFNSNLKEINLSHCYMDTYAINEIFLILRFNKNLRVLKMGLCTLNQRIVTSFAIFLNDIFMLDLLDISYNSFDVNFYNKLQKKVNNRLRNKYSIYELLNFKKFSNTNKLNEYGSYDERGHFQGAYSQQKYSARENDHNYNFRGIIRHLNLS